MTRRICVCYSNTEQHKTEIDEYVRVRVFEKKRKRTRKKKTEDEDESSAIIGADTPPFTLDILKIFFNKSLQLSCSIRESLLVA